MCAELRLRHVKLDTVVVSVRRRAWLAQLLTKVDVTRCVILVAAIFRQRLRVEAATIECLVTIAGRPGRWLLWAHLLALEFPLHEVWRCKALKVELHDLRDEPLHLGAVLLDFVNIDDLLVLEVLQEELKISMDDVLLR